MGGFLNITDYLNQGVGASAVDAAASDGSSVINLGGLLGDQGGGIPGVGGLVSLLGGQLFKGLPPEVGDFLNLGMDLIPAIAQLGLNPISDIKALADLPKLITDMINSFQGVPREAKTNGVLGYFMSYPDWRMKLIGRYIQTNILGKGYVLSSPPIDGANFYAFTGFVNQLVGPIPHAGEVVHIAVKDTQQGVGIPIAKGGWPKMKGLDPIPVLFRRSFGLKLPNTLATLDGAKILLKIGAASGHITQKFAKGVVSPRGQAISTAIAVLHQGGDTNGIDLLIRNVNNITTSDIANANSKPDFLTNKSLQHYCICAGGSTALDCSGEFHNMPNNNLPPSLNTLLNPSLSGGLPTGVQPSAPNLAQSNAQTGPINISINTGPDAAMEQLLLEHGLISNPAATSAPSGWLEYAILGVGVMGLLLTMRGKR